MSLTLSTDLARLVDLVEQFDRQTILIVGDFVADEFTFGEISRVSREAPVLILRQRHTETLPGGGANAANNLVSLGARVRAVSAVGDDAAGERLVQYCRDRCGTLALAHTQKIKNRWLVDFDSPRRAFTVTVENDGNAKVTVWDKAVQR